MDKHHMVTFINAQRNGDWLSCDLGEKLCERITAWMPCPELWKEECDEVN